MLVSSVMQNNAHTKTKTDFIIFHHGARKVLVPLPASFQDASKVARELFPFAASPGSSVTFETDELNICRGERVEIHHTCWEGVAKELANVHVVVMNENVKPELKKESSYAAEYLDANTTARQAANEDESEDEPFQSPRRRLAEPPKLPTSSRVDKGNGNNRTKKMGESVTAGSPSRVVPTTTTKRKGMFTPSKAKVLMSGKGKGTEKKVDPLNLFPDEPVKYKADSDAEDCAEVAGSLEPEENDGKAMDCKKDQMSDQVHGVFSGVGELKPQKDKQQTNYSRSNSHDTESSYIHIIQKRVSGTALTVAPSGQSATSDVPSTLPERILVVVEYEQGDFPDMKFRVRPTLSIARLLLAICKQFKLDNEQVQLHMLMLIDVENDEDTAVERVFCSPSETLASLGATEGQRFVVSEFGESS